MSSPSGQFTALVTGGTGAIGRELVAELLASPAWSRVVLVGRGSKWTPPAGWENKVDVKKEEESGRLVQKTVSFEELAGPLGGKGPESDPAFEKTDAAFCCLGTTHADAGGSAGFRRVDLDYVRAAATLSKNAGTPYFTHVTASGTGGFISGLSNYGRTKAAAEAAIKELGFAVTAAIYRPGMLDRGDKARTVEKWAGKLLPSIKVGAVARAMRLDAEETLTKMRKGEAMDKVFTIVEDAQISR